MRALVTGAGGFVGSHLAARLVRDGWEVAGTLRPGGSPWRLAALGVLDRMRVTEAELSEPGATVAVARSADPDVAFLAAAARASATPADRTQSASVNGAGARWLIEGLPARCQSVVMLGSSTEYAPTDGPIGEDAPRAPRSWFGATKAVGTVLVAAAAAQRRLRSSILRPFQVYGPFDHEGRLVPRALRAARSGHRLPLTRPGRRRDWVFVDDVVECCVRAGLAHHLPSGTVLNVGTGRQVTNEELVDQVGRVTGHPVDVAIGAHPGREWDSSSWVCDASRARDLLGWEAHVDLADGLTRCWERM